jgi:hypothetical protein
MPGLGLGFSLGLSGGSTGPNSFGSSTSPQIATISNDVFVGGGLGYTERLRQDGVFLQLIRELDDDGNSAEVWGQTISGNGERYVATPTGIARYDANTPGLQLHFEPTDAAHDVAWAPDNSGIYALISPSSGSLDLYKYSLDLATVLDGPNALDVDPGWTTAPAKLDVKCDSTTILYTMQGPTIFAYNATTHTQLAAYETLTGDDADRYIFGDLRIANDGKVWVAMTDTGTGPRRGIALSGSVIWTDEVNPTDGIYYVRKRRTSDRGITLSVITNLAPPNPPDGVNAPVFSLASYYARCQASRARTFIGLIA